MCKPVNSYLQCEWLAFPSFLWKTPSFECEAVGTYGDQHFIECCDSLQGVTIRDSKQRQHTNKIVCMGFLDGTVVFLRKTHVSSSRQDWWTCRQHLSKSDPLFSMKVNFTLTLQFFFFFCWVSSISKVSSSIFQKVEYNLWNILSFGGSKKEAFTFLFPLSLFEPALHKGSYLSQLCLSPHRGR